MRTSLLILVLLAGCGSSHTGGDDQACAPCVRGINMALSLTAPGSYVLDVSSPPGSQATCHVEIDGRSEARAPADASCGLSFTLSSDGLSVIGATLGEQFQQGGLVSLTRDGQTILSGSFEVRERTPSGPCACTSFYAVIFSGQGA